MTSQPPPDPPEAPERHGGGWVRPVAVIIACLIIGFVAGWVLRGDDGTVTVLESGTSTPGRSDGGGATTGTTGTTGTAPTSTAPAPTPPPSRDQIALVVLNATSTAGLAGETASRAESRGYTGVIAGNAPTSTDPSRGYFAAGERPAARRVARDLEIDDVVALPASGPIATAAQAARPDADVIVVLGP